MDIVIEFNTPYTRAQVRTGLNNLTLPTGAIVRVRSMARETGLTDVIDSDTDSIEVLKISSFTSFAEVASFVNSMPTGAYDRINRINIS